MRNLWGLIVFALRHPDHGIKHAQLPAEVEEDMRNGWVLLGGQEGPEGEPGTDRPTTGPVVPERPEPAKRKK